MTGLIERLLTQEPFRASDDGMTVAELPPPGKLRNPDGPEAADLIQQLYGCAVVALDFLETQVAPSAQRDTIINAIRELRTALAAPICTAHIADLERVWRCNGDPEDGDGMLEIEALRTALKRMIRNFDLLLAGKPVRDVAETRAEVLAAIAIGDR